MVSRSCESLLSWSQNEVSALLLTQCTHSLLSQLVNPQMADPVDIDILNETSVIIGAIANEGRITLRPLILARAPTSLLDLVRATSTSGLTALQQAKLLPSVLRALRNVMVSAADAVWGHAWGVAAELKLVGTGLVGPMEEDEVIGKGKGYSGRDGAWRQEAFLALKSICEVCFCSTWRICREDYSQLYSPTISTRCWLSCELRPTRRSCYPFTRCWRDWSSYRATATLCYNGSQRRNDWTNNEPDHRMCAETVYLYRCCCSQSRALRPSCPLFSNICWQ